MKPKPKSKRLYAQARQVIPGGVNSPVRAFKAVGGEPFLVEKGEGPWLFDVDGYRYIDYVCGWGSLILGHSHPQVVDALQKAIPRGTGYGIPTPMEVTMAQMIVDAFPSIEMVRMVNSGTEATMSALRLARAYTRREKILKFEGCYHGHSDMLLVAAGSGGLTLGIPDSPGVPAAAARSTLVAPFNDLESIKAILQANPNQIAAIIVEPIAANMGVVLPQPGFLQGLRDMTKEEGIILIFDEVITGFRVAYGGAQTLYSIEPDLTCLGKIIGGGLPVGAYGGKREIMEMVAPSGSVYQAGTLAGNPLTMVAGIETLRVLKTPGFYEELEKKAAKICQAMAHAAQEAKVLVYINRMGSMFTLFFTDSEVKDHKTAKASDTIKYASFFQGMLEEGIYFAPSQFEAAFLSAAHMEEDIQSTIRSAQKALESV